MKNRITEIRNGKEYLHLYNKKWLDLEPERLVSLYTDDETGGLREELYEKGELCLGFFKIAIEP